MPQMREFHAFSGFICVGRCARLVLLRVGSSLMNTVKSFLILCAVSSLLLSASCGSIDKSGSKPEINSQAAETIIAKRHAQSMVDAWRAGDRAEAAKEIKVLQSLLDIDANQLPQRAHQLLPEPSLNATQQK